MERFRIVAFSGPNNQVTLVPFFCEIEKTRFEVSKVLQHVTGLVKSRVLKGVPKFDALVRSTCTH